MIIIVVPVGCNAVSRQQAELEQHFGRDATASSVSELVAFRHTFECSSPGFDSTQR